MSNRYRNRRVVKNNRNLYNDFFAERNINHISQYDTPKIPYLDVDVRTKCSSVTHLWRLGDRYYKLADRYYDDPTYWWVIAWYNQRPLETDINIGGVVHIPLPLDDVLSYFY